VLAALRKVGTHPLLEPHVSRALRARLTTTPFRFWLRDLRGRGVYRYVIRSTGDEVVLEHGTSDVPTFDQAFYQNAHAPSPRAERTLAAMERPLAALDLGANIGMFGVWLRGRFPLRHVIAVEPMPRNIPLLRENLSRCLPGDCYTVLQEAACASTGPVAFGGGNEFTHGRVGGAAGELTVAGRDAFEWTDGIDLLKIDIEGGEWPILQDSRFRDLDVPVVMLEHHPQGAPGDPARAAEELLTAAGYVVERTLDGGDGTGIVWGVKDAARGEAGSEAAP
jgi:FkbM family methyltransferase